MPQKKSGSDGTFEAADSPAQRRLGQVEPGRSPGDALLLRNDKHASQIGQIHLVAPRVPIWLAIGAYA
jgi:hypothetical protein